MNDMAKVRCNFCKTYIDKSVAYNAGFSNYCSRCCFEQKRFQGPKLRAKKTPAKVNSSKFPREEVLRRDDYRCRFCGQKENLAVHHVHYKSEVKNRPWMDSPANLISLCNGTCHLKIVHGDKKKYQPLCLQIIWLTYVENNSRILIKDLDDAE